MGNIVNTAALLSSLISFSPDGQKTHPQFSSISVENLSDPRNPFSLYGEILATPKDSCLYIRQNIKKPDVKVCSPQVLRFYAEELDALGRFQWIILKNSNDMNEVLEWSTGYQVGSLVTDKKKWPSKKETFVIQSCISDKEKRKIQLQVFGDKKPWMITFPEEHYLEDQPPDPENLFIQKDDKESIFASDTAKEMKKGADLNQKDMAKDEDAYRVPERPKNLPKWEYRGLESGNRKTLNIFQQLKAEREKKEKGIQVSWTMRPRDAFTMNGSHFMAYGSVPPGSIGRCRYRKEENLKTWAMECHHVAGFHWIYFPLTCLSDLF